MLEFLFHPIGRALNWLGNHPRFIYWIGLLTLWSSLIGPFDQVLLLSFGANAEAMLYLLSLLATLVIGRKLWTTLQDPKCAALKEILLGIAGFWTVIAVSLALLALVMLALGMVIIGLDSAPSALEASDSPGVKLLSYAIPFYSDFGLVFVATCWLTFKFPGTRLAWLCSTLMWLPMFLSNHYDLSPLKFASHLLLCLGAALSGSYLGHRYYSDRANDESLAHPHPPQPLLKPSAIVAVGALLLFLISEILITPWKVQLAISNHDPKVRTHAAQQFAESNAPTAVRALINQIENEQGDSKTIAVGILGAILDAKPDPKLTQEAQPILITALEDETWSVRLTALQVLQPLLPEIDETEDRRQAGASILKMLAVIGSTPWEPDSSPTADLTALLKALPHIREGERAPIIEAMESESADQRRYAVWVLSHFQDESALKSIVQILNNETDPQVRHYAKLSMVHFLSEASETIDSATAVHSLINGLLDGSRSAPFPKAAFRNLGDSAVAPLLDLILTSTENNLDTQENCPLGRLQNDGRAFGQNFPRIVSTPRELIPHLGPTHLDEQFLMSVVSAPEGVVTPPMLAIHALAEIATKMEADSIRNQIIEPLIAGVGSENASVRAQAASAMNAVLDETSIPSSVESHLPFLISLLRDTHYEVRAHAAELLGTLIDGNGGVFGDLDVTDSLHLAMTDDSPHVRRHATQALGRSSSSFESEPATTIETLLARVGDPSEDDRVRDDAVRALRDLGSNTSNPEMTNGIAQALIELMHQADEPLRFETARALGSLVGAGGESDLSDTILGEIAAAYEITPSEAQELIEERIRWAYDYNRLAWKHATKTINPKLALPLAKKAVALEPNHEYLDTLGWAQFRMGQIKEALETFQRVLAIKPGFDSAWKGAFEVALIDLDAFNQFCDERSSQAPEAISVETWRTLAHARYFKHHGDIDQARVLEAKLGFISEENWRVVGPFQSHLGANSSRPVGFSRVFPPEKEFDLEATYRAYGEKITWIPANDQNDDGFIDLQELLTPNESTVAYAATQIVTANESQAQLRIGSSDDVKVWLNQSEVLGRKTHRGALPDQDIVPITLRPGVNDLLVKVCNLRGEWGFYLRITDRDGTPLAGLEFQ